MNKRFSFDPKCYELAQYFFEGAPEDMLRDAAQAIQDCVEGLFTDEAIARVEEDGDEIFMPMPTHCTQCRVGFAHDGTPLYALILERNGFMCCSVCGSSYGAASPIPRGDES